MEKRSNNPQGHNQYTENKSGTSRSGQSSQDKSHSGTQQAKSHNNNPEGHNQYTKNDKNGR